MPTVAVYIRVNDLDKWKALDNKSQAISNMLNAQPITVSKKFLETVNDYPQNIKENPDGTVSIADPTKPARLSGPKRINSVDDVKKIFPAAKDVTPKPEPTTYKPTNNWGA